MQDTKTIIEKFDLRSEPLCVRPFAGKRSESYLVDLADGTSVMLSRMPSDSGESEGTLRNIAELSEYARSQGFADESDIIKYVMTKSGEYCVVDNENIWRVGSFANRAHTGGDEPAEQKAGELGRALGLFHRRFADFPVEKLTSVYPNFHNTPLHFSEFEQAVKQAPPELCDGVSSELGFTQKQQSVCGSLLKMDLPARVTNNHVSLDSLLVDNATGRGVRFTSYDYVMPGMLPFDFGDGVAACCAAPSETNRNGIELDLTLFRRYCDGYLGEMKPLLIREEPASLALSAVVMPLERGIKELTRYLKTGGDPAALDSARLNLLISLEARRKYKELVDQVRESYTSVDGGEQG